VQKVGRPTKSSTNKQLWQRHYYDFNMHSFPKREVPENKSSNLAHFFTPKRSLPKHHVYHTFHHVLTIKKPPPNTHFPQNPQQKHQNSPPQK